MQLYGCKYKCNYLIAQIYLKLFFYENGQGVGEPWVARGATNRIHLLQNIVRLED